MKFELSAMVEDLEIVIKVDEFIPAQNPKICHNHDHPDFSDPGSGSDFTATPYLEVVDKDKKRKLIKLPDEIMEYIPNLEWMIEQEGLKILT